MSSSSGYERWDIKKLRDELEQANINALADAGLLSDKTVDYLLSYEQAYEPESEPHWETGEPAYYASNTERWHQIVRKELTKNIRKAVQNGHWEVVSYALGRGSAEEKVQMDFGNYEKHRSLLTEPGLVELMFAGMGGGKTMTAVRQAEVWMMLYPNGRVLSNIRSWAEEHPRVDHVETFRDLYETAQENPEQHTFVVLDEFGIKGSAYGGINQEAMQKVMHRFVRLMRKEPFKMRLVGISQRPTDIHPTLRNDSIAVYAIKEGASKAEKQKHMVIYDGTKDENCTAVDPESEIVDLHGIGMPEVPPDTNDKATWGWGDPADWVEIGLVTPEELDMDEDEIFGGDEEDGEVDLCQGTTKAGEPCPQPAWKGTGYCYNHQAQREDRGEETEESDGESDDDGGNVGVEELEKAGEALSDAAGGALEELDGEQREMLARSILDDLDEDGEGEVGG